MYERGRAARRVSCLALRDRVLTQAQRATRHPERAASTPSRHRASNIGLRTPRPRVPHTRSRDTRRVSGGAERETPRLGAWIHRVRAPCSLFTPYEASSHHASATPVPADRPRSAHPQGIAGGIPGPHHRGTRKNFHQARRSGVLVSIPRGRNARQSDARDRSPASRGSSKITGLKAGLAGRRNRAAVSSGLSLCRAVPPRSAVTRRASEPAETD